MILWGKRAVDRTIIASRVAYVWTPVIRNLFRIIYYHKSCPDRVDGWIEDLYIDLSWLPLSSKTPERLKEKYLYGDLWEGIEDQYPAISEGTISYLNRARREEDRSLPLIDKERKYQYSTICKDFCREYMQWLAKELAVHEREIPEKDIQVKIYSLLNKYDPWRP